MATKLNNIRFGIEWALSKEDGVTQLAYAFAWQVNDPDREPAPVVYTTGYYPDMVGAGQELFKGLTRALRVTADEFVDRGGMRLTASGFLSRTGEVHNA